MSNQQNLFPIHLSRELHRRLKLVSVALDITMREAAAQAIEGWLYEVEAGMEGEISGIVKGGIGLGRLKGEKEEEEDKEVLDLNRPGWTGAQVLGKDASGRDVIVTGLPGPQDRDREAETEEEKERRLRREVGDDVYERVVAPFKNGEWRKKREERRDKETGGDEGSSL